VDYIINIKFINPWGVDLMVTSEEIRRKLEEKKRAKMEGSRPTSSPGQAPTSKSATSPPKSQGSGLPRPKAPPASAPVRENQERKPTEAPVAPAPEVEAEEPATVEEIVKHCPNCDVDYSNDTNFCPDCGSKLEDVVEEVAEDIPEEEVVEEVPSEETYEEPEMEVVRPEDIPLNTATFADDIVVVTSNFVPGFKAVETLGFVYGLTVRSRGVGGQIGAGIRSMFGGEIKEYVHMMEESRNQALERMIEHARSMGANAIISSRFDSDQISDIMQEILAYGTAVIIEEEDSQ
jgi:uncharacterized protein YbjQ (UPF0145 family)